MEKRLSVIRAARLAGVTRAELQSLIKRGQLSSFDGLVDVDDLLGLYPETRLVDDRALERVEQIKAEALGKDIAGRSLPDPQVLAQRLARLGSQLSRLRQQAEHYALVLESLETHLRTLEKAPDAETRAVVQDIKHTVQSALHERRVLSYAAGSGLDGGSWWMSILAPQVRLVPDDHEFLVEGADTVLEAALRAGLSIGYGCSNGNCGECKARIVSGEVRDVRPHDFVISETERSEGYALLCSVAPVTDLVIEVGVARRPEQVPVQTIDAMVREIARPGPHILLLKVQTPRTKRLRFLGGQYARLSVGGNGLEGMVPLANCPCDDRNLAFHITENRQDPFTVHCFEQLRKGDPVRVEAPFGTFVIEDEIDRPLVFIACDAGFGPVKSLIEHVIALDRVDAMHLIWVASGAVGHYEDNLCRSWEDALDHFHYRPIRTNTVSDVESWSTTLAGSLEKLQDPGTLCYYVAGPERFADAVRELLGRLGVATSQCRYQALPPRPVASSHDDGDSVTGG
jgi:CDP-4-dehydro-6-deoxyglucose reductase, E3